MPILFALILIGGWKYQDFAGDRPASPTEPPAVAPAAARPSARVHAPVEPLPTVPAAARPSVTVPRSPAPVAPQPQTRSPFQLDEKLPSAQPVPLEPTCLRGRERRLQRASDGTVRSNPLAQWARAPQAGLVQVIAPPQTIYSTYVPQVVQSYESYPVIEAPLAPTVRYQVSVPQQVLASPQAAAIGLSSWPTNSFGRCPSGTCPR